MNKLLLQRAEDKPDSSFCRMLFFSMLNFFHSFFGGRGARNGKKTRKYQLAKKNNEIFPRGVQLGIEHTVDLVKLKPGHQKECKGMLLEQYLLSTP